MKSPDLQVLFDEAIAEDTDDFGPPKHFRFSNLGKCPRAQVMERMGCEKTPFDVKTRILLKIGRLLETQALEWLATKVDIIAKQVTVEAPEWDARGHADALARIGNDIVPIEVKSTRDRGVEYAPYPNHVLQVSAYAIFLNLPTSFLLYVGRDGARKFVECRPSLDVERKIKNEWALLGGWFRSGAVPPKTPWTQATKKVGGKEVPWVYERSGPWGEVGTPKLEPPKVSSYCAFSESPMCCRFRDEGGSDVQDVSKQEGGEESVLRPVSPRGEAEGVSEVSGDPRLSGVTTSLSDLTEGEDQEV